VVAAAAEVERWADHDNPSINRAMARNPWQLA